MAKVRVLLPGNVLRGRGIPDTVAAANPVITFIMDTTEPTALNTGPRFPITTTSNGNLTLSTAQTIRNTRINGRISIPASVSVASGQPNVILIEDCIIDASQVAITAPGNVINISTATNTRVIIRHCEIIGRAGLTGIGNRRFTAERNHIHHVEDHFRCHNSGSTSVAAAETEIMGNFCTGAITRVPDPYINRTDNRTHNDCVQIEGGDGVNIHGNTLQAWNTTDGTSNIRWFNTTVSPRVAGSTLPFPAGATDHSLQSMAAVLLSPNVSPITNLKVNRNWIYGGAIPFNFGGAPAVTGQVNGNRFDRTAFYVGQSITFASGSNGATALSNTYMDNNSDVTVRR